MNFRERWRIAGIIALQMRFDGFLKNNPGNVARIKEDPQKISRSIKSASKVNSLLSTFMIVMLAVLTIGVTGFDTPIGELNVRLAIGFSFFMVLAFVLIFFLNLTTLPQKIKMYDNVVRKMTTCFYEILVNKLIDIYDHCKHVR